MSRILVACVLVFVLATSVHPATRQITIKVVNGHDGKPFKNTTVDVWYGTKAIPPPMLVTTTDDGYATLAVPDAIETIMIAAQLVGDCRSGEPKNFIENNVYRVQDILRTGVVAENACGKTKSQQTPGVLVFYVRPLHWWEKLMGS